MRLPIPAAGRLAILLCVLVVIGLGIGPASAAQASATGSTSAHNGAGSGHHITPNSSWQHKTGSANLTQFRKTGGNLTSPQTRAWPGKAQGFSGNQTHKMTGFAPNATLQQERITAFATALEKQGVDVSALETAIKDNNTAAERAWFTSYMQAHQNQSLSETQKKRTFFAPNATVQQEHFQALITGLQQQGVDVSTVQADLKDNDTAAAKTWIAEYLKTHKGLSNTTRQQWHPWNATVSKTA